MTPPASPSSEWSPFRIEPMFVGRVWGYHDLRPWFDRTSDGQPIGEVWLTGDNCPVATGVHAGRTLASLFDHAHGEMMGNSADSHGSPLLVKVIFAAEKLSVQVHPDDALARKYGFPRGKTECWYVLQAQPGAKVAAGLKPNTTNVLLRNGISTGTLEDSLNVLPISTGEMILVDAGTVHAIWPGSILLEVQQNSDITYRLYDYGRPRELHIEKGLEAVQFTTHAGKVPPQVAADRTVLIDVENFRVERLAVNGSRSSKSISGGDAETGISGASGPGYFFAASGSGLIQVDGLEPVELPSRGMACVPAAAPEFEVRNLGGLDLIRISAR